MVQNELNWEDSDYDVEYEVTSHRDNYSSLGIEWMKQNNTSRCYWSALNSIQYKAEHQFPD